jgi:hypothetical protein
VGPNIEEILGDTGSITGNIVTIYANNAANNSGATVKFVNSGTTSTFDVSNSVNNSTLIGGLAGNSTVASSGSNNTVLGYSSFSSATNTSNCTAIGYQALTSVVGAGGSGNTAVGSACLDNVGSTAFNTGIGYRAGNQSLDGHDNCFVGYSSGYQIPHGNQNVIVGSSAAANILGTSSNNIILGYQAASNYVLNESSNIAIGNAGVASENNVIRIGTQGTGAGQQNSCNIAGITGATPTSGNTPQVVLCDDTGNLAPISSSTSGFVLTSNGTATPSFQAPAATAGLMIASGNLTNTQIKNLHGSPVVVIAAPGSGKAIQLIHATMTMNYGGNNAFVNGGGTALVIAYTIPTTIITSLTNTQITATTSQINFASAAGAVSPTYAAGTNIGVQIYNTNPTEISGNAANDNTMSYNILYRIITIP